MSKMNKEPKNRLSFSMVICVVFLLFGGAECEKATMPQTEHGKLPKKTQTGADTFGCLIDDTAFVPHVPWSFWPPHTDSEEAFYSYDFNTNTNIFSIHTYHEGSGWSSSMNFELNQIDLAEKTYVISDQTLPECFGVGYKRDYNDYYTTNSNVTGELNISHFDPVNNIVSGTFWFDAINQDGKIIQVREGRFDLKFNQ